MVKKYYLKPTLCCLSGTWEFQKHIIDAILFISVLLSSKTHLEPACVFSPKPRGSWPAGHRYWIRHHSPATPWLQGSQSLWQNYLTNETLGAARETERKNNKQLLTTACTQQGHSHGNSHPDRINRLHFCNAGQPVPRSSSHCGGNSSGEKQGSHQGFKTPTTCNGCSLPSKWRWGSIAHQRRI